MPSSLANCSNFVHRLALTVTKLELFKLNVNNFTTNIKPQNHKES